MYFCCKTVITASLFDKAICQEFKPEQEFKIFTWGYKKRRLMWFNSWQGVKIGGGRIFLEFVGVKHFSGGKSFNCL